MKTKRSFKLQPRFKTPLHLACSNDNLREKLNYIHFQDGWACASDAHIIAFCNLFDFGFSEEECKKLHGKSIHRKQYAKLYKEHFVITNEGICITQYDCTYQLKDTNSFDGQNVVEWMRNAVEGKISNQIKKEKVDKIGISTFLLKTLSNCIDCKHVVLEFKTMNNAIKVMPTNTEQSHYGYIMPVMMQNN